MNFSQMYEVFRRVCLHRIQRGDLTMAELARRSGLSKSHVWKFLGAHGQLSPKAADRLLHALELGAEDLVVLGRQIPLRENHDVRVPVVSHSTALFEPDIGLHAVELWLAIPPEEMPSRAPLTPLWRRSWRRFVGTRIDREEARSMSRPEYSGAIAVIDRHFSSLRQYDPDQPNIYAIRDGNRVAMRYVDAFENQLIIRPASAESPPKLIKVAPGSRPADYIAGRVALVLLKKP